jgi:predicted nucleotidyltransferase
MLNLDPDDFKEVLIILRSHLKNCDVFAFGSRVHGRCQKFSDLDYC